jgi:translation initiation factor IF-3
MAHQEFGMRLLERVKSDLDEVAVVEQFPKMEGRQLVMVLAPKKKVVPVKGTPAKAGDKPAAAKPAVSPEAVKPVATPDKVVAAESVTAQNAVTEEKK